MTPEKSLHEEVQVTDSRYPHRFVMIDESCITAYFKFKSETESAVKLKLVKKLEGRGHQGFAAFYELPDGRQLLLKSDPSEICLLEGSASFVNNLIPPAYSSSINFAHVGLLEYENTRQMSVITVQDAVIPHQTEHKITPWDVVVFGKKREPKTLISTEFYYQKTIYDTIDAFNENLKWQLATAIFASTALGDESLHLGQFLVEVNLKSNSIEGITRIDLGARERYGSMRAKHEDFKHATSKLYASSGQFFKWYIYYHLQHPEIKTKYLSLWARDINITKTAQQHKNHFLHEIEKLNLSQQKEALEGVLDVIYKKSQAVKKEAYSNLKLNELKIKVADLLQSITIIRLTSLQKKARKKLTKTINQAVNQLDINISFGDTSDITFMDIIKKLIDTTNNKTAYYLAATHSTLSLALSKIEPSKAHLIGSICEIIINRQAPCINEPISESLEQEIQAHSSNFKKLKTRIKIIELLQQHYHYLNGLIFKSTDFSSSSSSRKREIITESIRSLCDGIPPDLVLNAEFFESISERGYNFEFFGVHDDSGESPNFISKLKTLLQYFSHSHPQNLLASIV